MIPLLFKILLSWCLLSSIASWAWARIMSVGRLTEMHDQVVVAVPADGLQPASGMRQLYPSSF
jgi:hypothetical protein